MEEYLIGVAVNILLTALKDPKKKDKIRKIAKKVFDALRAAFPEFE